MSTAEEDDHYAVLKRRFDNSLEETPEQRHVRELRQIVIGQCEDASAGRFRTTQMNVKISPELRALVRADAKIKKLTHEVQYFERAIIAFARSK